MASTKKPKREPFARIEQSEAGTQIDRIAPISRPVVLTDLGKLAHDLARWESDEGRAYKRLRDILNAACVDPAVVKSENAGKFAQLMRDLFYEAQPGEPPELFMQPVETLFAGMRSRDGGGGRPPNVDRWEQWSGRYEELRSTRRTLRLKNDTKT